MGRLAWRCAAAARDAPALAAALEQLAQACQDTSSLPEKESTPVVSVCGGAARCALASAVDCKAPRVCLVFTGQGAAYGRMGATLAETSPAYERARHSVTF